MLIEYGILGLVILVLLTASIKILDEWERGVILRLGRLTGVRGPGWILLIPGLEKMVRISLRTITMDIQPQDVITKDNVSLQVNAVIYFRVVNPQDALTQIEDYYFATSQLSQTTLRSICGQYTLDDLLTNRDQINQSLQEILDLDTEPWGVKVAKVEIKHIDLPKEMQRAMAGEAQAERDRRAKVIAAEGELQRSEKLTQASEKMSTSPLSLQLAYLQTMKEMSSSGNSTVILPVPIDLVKPLLKVLESKES